MSEASEIIKKLLKFGAGTKDSLIYGSINGTSRDFIYTRDASSRVPYGYDRNGNQKYRRSDWSTCEKIRDMVTSGILEMFTVTNSSEYKVTYFYKLSGDLKSEFNGSDYVDSELRQFVYDRRRKSRKIYATDSSSRIELTLASLARTHLGFHTETVASIIESEGPEADIPNVLNRTTKDGVSLRTELCKYGLYEVTSYFESRNLSELNSQMRKQIFEEFIHGGEDTRKRIIQNFIDNRNEQSLIQRMKYDNIMEFYKNHRESLVEYVKRNTELDKLEEQKVAV
jgi:hypothetical protein